MTEVLPRRGLRLGSSAVSFNFDGRAFTGIEGDTAASALLASGVRLFGRSVKYRRRRGVLTAGPEEPNALVTVGNAPYVIPNVPAPQLVLHADQKIASQNCWPSLRFDLASLLRLGGGLLGAGFYYKTFIWPSWRAYEGMIRRLAGLGAAPAASDLPLADSEHLQCDVVIAGAGPAGLTAALAAVRAGVRVVICEREVVAGGELEFETASINGRPALLWVAEALRELRDRSVRILLETTVVSASGGLVIAHRELGGLPGNDVLYRIHARAFVTAMGAIERPIAFIDNDLPGIMLLGAAERYLARYGVRVGQNLVLFGNHDRLYSAAQRFIAAGMPVRAIVDTRVESASAQRVALVRSGVECLLGSVVLAAQGRVAVTGARIAPLATPALAQHIACDALLVSGGWSAPEYFSVSGDPSDSVRRVSIGAANDQFELEGLLKEAYTAGVRAASRSATTTQTSPAADISGAPIGQGDGAPNLLPFWRSPASRADEKRQFVDFQNDVTVADLRQALVEGFVDIEHIKRYTTLGIGTEQGRTGGALGAAIIAELAGTAAQSMRASRARPPYRSVSLTALSGLRVGNDLRPERCTPLHEWHQQHGAVLEPSGPWMRPRFYRANGADAFTAGVAEAARVREFGGVVDGSTLGKIEVVGPDAAAFLDRIYLNPANTLKVGRSKYMVLLREDGMVLDDGIVLRLAEHRFLATVSSAHAAHVLSHFEFWCETECAALAVVVTDVTEAWSVIIVAGPTSRDTLCSVLGIDWESPVAKLAHMAFHIGSWQGRELRALRASFSGELAFELHCKPSIALPLWQALVDAGMSPYGLEALDILRVEKGYLTGAEFNGQTTPEDLGMDKLVSLGNACVGRALLDRPGLQTTNRPRLVGLRGAQRGTKFLPGAQITTLDAPTRGCGHITSSAYSPALGEWIALALVARDVSDEGTELLARDPLRGGDACVRVVSGVHFDPDGARMKS